MTDKYNGYSIDDLSPYLKGDIPWPNFKYLKPDQAIDRLFTAGRQYHKGSICVGGKNCWAAYFLDTNQHGSFTGEAIVLYFGENAARVSVCDHKRLKDGGQSNGYDKGRCRKCGLNMTFDSGN